MLDRIDVDEKWFHLIYDGENYILACGSDEDNDNDEEIPHRTTRHKRHITKVMFLCAQARPRYDTRRKCWWDGKIGMWPIGSMQPAQRKLVRRPAGTMEWRNDSITKEKYREILLEKVVPAIIEKWPRDT